MITALSSMGLFLGIELLRDLIQISQKEKTTYFPSCVTSPCDAQMGFKFPTSEHPQKNNTGPSSWLVGFRLELFKIHVICCFLSMAAIAPLKLALSPCRFSGGVLVVRLGRAWGLLRANMVLEVVFEVMPLPNIIAPSMNVTRSVFAHTLERRGPSHLGTYSSW